MAYFGRWAAPIATRLSPLQGLGAIAAPRYDGTRLPYTGSPESWLCALRRFNKNQTTVWNIAPQATPPALLPLLPTDERIFSGIIEFSMVSKNAMHLRRSKGVLWTTGDAMKYYSRESKANNINL